MSIVSKPLHPATQTRSLPRLSRRFLQENPALPADLQVNRPLLARRLPERILQFGEGVFLRAFVDWMIHELNSRGLFDGRIVVVNPIPASAPKVAEINQQDGLYTLLLRGREHGQTLDRRQVIDSISRGLDPYCNYDEFLKIAASPDLRFVVSNTTEAGIVYAPADRAADAPPASFPGKVAALLHARWQAFGGDPARGLIFIPVELIKNNGEALKRCVLQVAENWRLPRACIDWIGQHNIFVSTLVDRIVTGYPKDEAEQIFQRLSCQDTLLVAAEPYHAWVLQAPPAVAEELPLHRANLNVTWTDNIGPYRERKVRILNGGHTMMVLAAYLAGKDTVGQCMADPLIRRFLTEALQREVIPTLNLPQKELEDFAAAVIERFENPFVKHALLSIALNSTSKFKSRVLPTIKDFLSKTGKLPARLTFSLAALIAFYRGAEIRDGALIGHRNHHEYRIADDAPALKLFAAAWQEFQQTSDTHPLARRILAASEIWGEDLNALPGFTSAVATDLNQILTRGPLTAMSELNDPAD